MSRVVAWILPLVAASAAVSMAAQAAGEAPPATPSTDDGVATLFRTHCLVCHGADARGVEGLGVSLVGSEYVAAQTADDLVAFLQRGRMPDDPASISSRPMPGFAWLSDGELRQLAGYVQSLTAH